MAGFHAEGGDDHVDRLADRDAVLPHYPIVARRARCQMLTEHAADFELAKMMFDDGGVGLVTRTLKQLEHDDIAD